MLRILTGMKIDHLEDRIDDGIAASRAATPGERMAECMVKYRLRIAGARA